MTRAIVLETSGAHSEVALADETGLCAHRHLSAARKHARDVVPTLHELLAELAWEPGSIDLVVVDVGPGSYTGLRAGVVTAKSFAYAAGAPLIGVDSMTILAEDAPAPFPRVAAIVDAQQGLVYAAELTKPTAGAEGYQEPTLVQPVTIIPATQWAEQLPPDAYITGPALTRFSHLVPEGRAAAAPGRFHPSAAGLWRLGWSRFQRGVRDDLWSLEPLYLRASSAQIKWDKRIEEKDASPS